MPSLEIRLANFFSNRRFISVGIERHSSMVQRSTAFELTLFTFCPPGPGERANENWNSDRGIEIFSLMKSMVLEGIGILRITIRNRFVQSGLFRWSISGAKIYGVYS